jgi:hypothetical protein
VPEPAPEAPVAAPDAPVGAPPVVAPDGVADVDGYAAPSALISNGADVTHTCMRGYQSARRCERKEEGTNVGRVERVRELERVARAGRLRGLVRVDLLRTVVVHLDGHDGHRLRQQVRVAVRDPASRQEGRGERRKGVHTGW